jgi:hypothetical protein
VFVVCLLEPIEVGDDHAHGLGALGIGERKRLVPRQPVSDPGQRVAVRGPVDRAIGVGELQDLGDPGAAVAGHVCEDAAPG